MIMQEMPEHKPSPVPRTGGIGASQPGGCETAARTHNRGRERRANVRSSTRGLFGSRGCSLHGIDGVPPFVYLRGELR